MKFGLTVTGIFDIKRERKANCKYRIFRKSDYVGPRLIQMGTTTI